LGKMPITVVDFVIHTLAKKLKTMSTELAPV
jgi:hypothetical protein